MIDVLGGTHEQAWQTCPTLAGLGGLELPGPGRAVVVAPHPDDEVLGVGGTMALLASLGWRIELIAATDGEASHPGSDAITRSQLRRRRPFESARAREYLGVSLAAEHRLGLADGGLSGSYQQLVDRLVELVAPGAWVLATWRGDGHPDHEAVGRASAEAASAVGATLVEYPVWTWNWASPGDTRVPWPRARVISLDPAAQAAKAAAVGAFRSQLVSQGPSPADGPVLPTGMLAHFARPFEVVFV